MTAQRLPRRRPVIGAVSAALAITSVVGIGITAALTDAAYSDYAHVNIGEGQTGTGIGVKQNFDIALVDRAGVVAAGGPTAVSLAIAPEITSDFAPGRTIETSATVFNNTPRWKAGVRVSLSSTGSAAMLSHLRFTAIDTATGVVIFGNATDPTRGVRLANASASLARTLSGTGATPVKPGGSAAPVPAASRADIRLIVTYLDDLSAAEKESLNGTTVPLTVTFAAEKV